MKVWICSCDNEAEIVKVVDSPDKAENFLQENSEEHWTIGPLEVE